ncbi:hypothetical protein [Streptomyces sp. HF10]|uniref:hypothetical protein n=1 Tax=Streptomyces sp. HF10 TaxID=2692233 RepID=UPI001F212B91|nr:hypothetical protein [Streptomyces sp. HF10]
MRARRAARRSSSWLSSLEIFSSSASTVRRSLSAARTAAACSPSVRTLASSWAAAHFSRAATSGMASVIGAGAGAGAGCPESCSAAVMMAVTSSSETFSSAEILSVL